MIALLRLSVAFVAAGVSAAAETTHPGDPARGADVYRVCVACHAIGQGATNGAGPHLNAVFGPAGASPNYAYSDALVAAANDGLIWDDKTLDAFLASPQTMIPDTSMGFSGLKDLQARADLIAYLKSVPVPAVGYTVSDDILAIEGDPAYGEYLSGECTSCHQTSGASGGVPSIAGLPEVQFVTAMHSYKTGVREHAAMQMMAGRLSNEEIAALAAYFGSVE